MAASTRCAHSIAVVHRLLLAEDDEGIREPLMRAFRREEYAVDAVADGGEAARLGVEEEYDLVVIDIGLPTLDGLEVCRRVRETHPRVPILILTAQSDELDVVEGLDAGADDYVAKPFRLGELLARVRALLRRAAPAEMAARGIRLDADARRVFKDGEEIALTPKEFDLLALLLANAGSVVRRERLMSQVWDENWFGSTKTLDVHMSSLRRKLGDDGADPELITTVRGVGFRFET
jgi:DNA-binding response OmpR family regulator